MTKPKITIITICYNSKQFIKQTIESVLGQTYNNVEYIIIDGGSTDGTQDIISHYSNKLAYWCSEKDGGIYDAMNKGVKQASGNWISFMNSGDCFADNEVLHKLFIDIAALEQVKVLYGDVVSVSEFGEKYIKAGKANILKYDMPFCHQSVFVRSNIMHENPFDLQYKIAADYNLFNKLFYQYGEKCFAYIPVCVSKVDTTDSLCRSKLYSCWVEYLKIRSSHKDFRWYYDEFKKIVKIILHRNHD